MSQILNIQPFANHMYEKKGFYLVAGGPRSGKTAVSQKIVNQIGSNDLYVFDHTDASNGRYTSKFDHALVFEVYSKKKLTTVVERQLEKIRNLKEKYENSHRFDRHIDDIRMTIVLDDVLPAEGGWLHDEILHELLKKASSWYICVIMTAETPTSLPTEITSSTNMVLLTGGDTAGSQKWLYKTFCKEPNFFNSFVKFKRCLETLTKEPDHSMVLTPNSGVFWNNGLSNLVGESSQSHDGPIRVELDGDKWLIDGEEQEQLEITPEDLDEMTVVEDSTNKFNLLNPFSWF